jgi:hypothetical protein
LQSEFVDLTMMKDPPEKVQRLLLVAAIFTQSVPELFRNWDGKELFSNRKQVLGGIAITTLTRKVFDHHATIQKSIRVISSVQQE